MENRHKAHVWAGIGDWLLTGASDAEKVQVGRTLGVQGISFFAFDSLMGEDPESTVKDASKLDTLLKTVYQQKVPVPDFRAPQPDAKPPETAIPKPSEAEQPRW